MELATPQTAPPPVAARLAEVRSSPVREILALTQQPSVISFAGGLPAPELFDAEGVAAAFAAVLSDAGTALQYSTTEGHPPLRAALAARMAARGLATTAAQVLVTTGSQQALGLVAAALLDPGDTVLVEDPSYLAALQSFALAGARLVPVPSDADGIDPDALRALVLEHRPKLLYVVPTFQNPTGRTLPPARRAAVAAVAGELGLWLLEDDPYGELRFAGTPVPPLATYPGATDRTIAVSSLSKVVAPGLRIGWLRAPEALQPALTIAKQAADLHTSTVDQMAAAHVLAAGLDAHLERIRGVYRERRDTLVDGLGDALPPGSSWNAPDGGMFVWARLGGGMDASALLPRALEHDVAFVPGAPFYAGEPDRTALRLSFTTHTPEEIALGLERLGAAVRAFGVSVPARLAPDAPRCSWAVGEEYVAYHDLEWGVPKRDERELFELLNLEGAQAGLSWITILRKREGYRRAFAGWDADAIARFGDEDRDRLLADPGIVRNRAKVAATIGNAQALLALQASGSSLSELLWSAVDGEPVLNRWATMADVPAETDASRALSKRLRTAGFRFVGPTITYALMQSAGLVGDHILGCACHPQFRA